MPLLILTVCNGGPGHEHLNRLLNARFIKLFDEGLRKHFNTVGLIWERSFQCSDFQLSIDWESSMTMRAHSCDLKFSLQYMPGGPFDDSATPSIVQILAQHVPFGTTFSLECQGFGQVMYDTGAGSWPVRN